jgi:hypothetical protein
VRGVGTVLLLGLAACGGERRATPGPLALRIEPAASATRLVLTAAPGWKINARVKPALETTEGNILRFDSVHLTPDSAYFADAPSATVPGRPEAVRGTLRASVCAAGERVCRVVSFAVRGEG